MEPAPPNGEPPEETSPESSEPIEPSVEPKPSPPKGFPVTFSGVASFSETGWGRLLGWQFLIALALGGAVLLVLARHWAPVVDSVMQQLPAETGWRNGVLVWPDDKPVEFGRNNYFCLIVDPEGTARHGQLADVQVELRREDWLLAAGCWRLAAGGWLLAAAGWLAGWVPGERQGRSGRKNVPKPSCFSDQSDIPDRLA